MARKTMSPAELRRFAQRLGASALIDPESRPYRDTGVAYMSMDDEEAFEGLGARLSVGVDEDAWRTWLSAEVPGG